MEKYTCINSHIKTQIWQYNNKDYSTYDNAEGGISECE